MYTNIVTVRTYQMSMTSSVRTDALKFLISITDKKLDNSKFISCHICIFIYLVHTRQDHRYHISLNILNIRT